jgi:hypothetical protein
MALLGFAGGGQLGNFGAIGVDQGTFGFAVFFWFAVVGAVTVAMTGGVLRRRKPPKPRPGPPPAGPDEDFAVIAEPVPQTDTDEDVGIVAEVDQAPPVQSTAEHPGGTFD